MQINKPLKLTSGIALLSIITVFSTNSFANQNPLTGTGELGFSDSTGNTQSTALYGSLKLSYDQIDYALKSALEISYKSENGNQTEERYSFDNQYNRYYEKDRNYYSYVGLKLEKSVFEDIELDTTASLGLGKTLYKTEKTQLSGQIGAGQQSTDYISAANSSESQVVYIGKLDLTHKINQQVNFTQDFNYTTGNEQTKIEANTGFAVKVAEKMNLKASYKYRNNSNPAAGTKKTDTLTVLTLTYDF